MVAQALIQCRFCGYLFSVGSVYSVKADLECGVFTDYRGHGIAIGYMTDDSFYGAKGFSSLDENRQ